MSENKDPKPGSTPAPVDNPVANRRIRKGPKVLGTIILVVLGIAAVGFSGNWMIDKLAWVSTDDASIDGQQMKLSSRTLGRINAILVREGENVHAGQLLATLDDSDLRAQEAQAQASLNYARKNLELAKVNLDRSEADFTRIQQLYSGSAATKESYDHARMAVDTAKAQFTVAQAQIETSNAQLGVVTVQLRNVQVSSPIAGTVDKISLNPGDLAQPGQAILSVNNLASVWIIANLEETMIGKIRIGAPVRIMVDSIPGKIFEGQVELVRSGIVPPAFQIGEFTKTTQRVPVKITFTTPLADEMLLPGMSAVIKVRTDSVIPGYLTQILHVLHLEHLVR
jgi:membrane fusion protein, multidrug efflux system